MISGKEKLLALDPKTGAVKFTATPVNGPRVISVNNGRMAVLSPVTGKIHLFDCSDPAHLQPLRTIGSGDGPYGPMRRDRFWFQQANNRTREPKMWVALNSKEEAMVVDSQRISFWTADGKLKRQGMGFWGQHILYGKFAGDTNVRMWGIGGDYSMKMDSKHGQWAPDTYWQLPVLNYFGRSPMGFFTVQGRNFAAYVVKGLGSNTTTYGKGFAIVEFTGFVGTARTVYIQVNKQSLVMLHDSNHDGVIDDKDTAEPVLNAAGTQMKGIPYSRYDTLDQQGNISLPGNGGKASMGTVINFGGFDADGNPVYDWAHPASIPGVVKTDLTLTSPYDYKTAEILNKGMISQTPPLSDGGYAAGVNLKTSGGTGLANGANTDIAGFGKDGTLRWFARFNFCQGTEGVQTIPQYGMVMGMDSGQCNYMVLDEDGLGLGMLGMPKEAHWSGMNSDHAQQQQAWVGNDGQPYYVLGDYVVNGYHWFRILGTESIQRSRVPVTLGAERAAALAALPVVLPEPPPAPPTPKITIHKLAQPLPIDGELQKSRDAGIQPAAIVTPETGTADLPARGTAAPSSAWLTRAATSTCRRWSSTTWSPSTSR